MKLLTVHVTNFRSVEDGEEFNAEGTLDEPGLADPTTVVRARTSLSNGHD